jgi:antitoxin HicB
MESRSDFPYRIVVEYSQEDGLFVARVPALPGCSAHGRTADAAAREALEAAGGILDTLAAHGEAAPPAEAGRDYSGHLRLRLPRYLHERLARRAAIEGVSLNQLMVTLLAEGAGIPRGFSSRPLPGLVADAAEPYGPERRSAKSRREKKVRESRASARGGLR